MPFILSYLKSFRRYGRQKRTQIACFLAFLAIFAKIVQKIWTKTSGKNAFIWAFLANFGLKCKVFVINPSSDHYFYRLSNSEF